MSKCIFNVFSLNIHNEKLRDDKIDITSQFLVNTIYVAAYVIYTLVQYVHLDNYSKMVT